MTLVKLTPYHKIFYNDWLISPDCKNYNIVFDQTLSPSLNVSKLDFALRKFISDNFIYNCHVIEINNEPYWDQNEKIISLELFDVELSYQQIHEYVSKPFNLQNGPLYRFAIICNSDGNYRFIIVLHHIIFDGCSVEPFIKQIVAYYNNLEHKALFSAEEQIALISSVSNKLEAQINLYANNGRQFWHTALTGIKPLDLKFLRLMQNLEKYDCANINFVKLIHDMPPNMEKINEIRFTIDVNDIQRLKNLKQQYSMSGYLYSQLIFGIILHKYTLQDNFAISYPIAIKECTRLIFGSGINTILLPYRINNETTIIDLINSVNNFIKLQNGDYNYSYYPINEIMATENKELLKVIFAQTNFRDAGFTFSNVNVIKINNEFNVDLMAQLAFEQEVHGEKLHFRVKYNATQIDERILCEFIDNYQKIFHAVLNDLEQNKDTNLIKSYSILNITNVQLSESSMPERSLNFWKSYLYDVTLVKSNWRFCDTLIHDNCLISSCFKVTSRDFYDIKIFASKNAVSVDSVFLYAYIKTLSFFLNSQDITIGLSLNNGIFPFRNNLTNVQTVSEGLLKVSENKNQIYNNSGEACGPHMSQITSNYIKSLFEYHLYEFIFNFQKISESKTHESKILETNILDTLNVYQFDDSEFIVKFTVGNNRMDHDYLEYFMGYLKQMLINVVHDSNTLFLDESDHKSLDIIYNGLIPQQYDTIHKVFAKQVTKSPNNIAVVHCEDSMTYIELDNKANQLANFLISEYNYKEESLVAICLDKGLLMPITMLAILKSGGAYVPINMNYPAHRIKQIISNADINTVCTTLKYFERLSSIFASELASGGFYLIVLDDDTTIANINKESSTISFNYGDFNSLAYVIYTSGSTGEPKGVMVEHKGVLSLVKNVDYVKFSESDCIMQMADIAFDATTFEVWGALLNGAKLLFPRDTLDTLSDIIYLRQIIEDNGVSILFITTVVFKLLISQKSNLFQGLKYLLIGGEVLHHGSVKELMNSDEKPCHVMNVYGPTENTVFSCIYEIKADYQFSGVNSVPIGVSLPNRQAYVLNSNLEQLPIGVVGELYLGGIGVARGYVNRADSTEDRFLSDIVKYGNMNYNDGARIDIIQSENIKLGKLYKTGDLVRYLPDGNLEYIGRNDTQVKINGYRIELLEVENVLNQYPLIKQAVICLSRDVYEIISKENPEYIIVYYLADYKLDENLLMTYLKEKFPEYMLPKVFMYISEIPLLNNGKINKRALPKPSLVNYDVYVSPRNYSEVIFCKTYAELLNISEFQIGVNHDFFTLGGNSILAIRMVAKLQNEFKINVSDVFNLRTPSKLAAVAIINKGYLTNKLQQIPLMHQKLSFWKDEDLSSVQEKKRLYFKDISSQNIISKFKKIRWVLLTGATGNLGCYILNQLLSATSYKIYLLIRGDSEYGAYSRLKARFNFYFNMDLNCFKDRIKIFVSDLEVENLNLSMRYYQELVDNVDSIIHAAALIKHYGNYDVFYSANVKATLNLLELSKLTKFKDFHYISTTGIFLDGHIANHEHYMVTEDDAVDILSNQTNVYLKTKYEAEVLTCKYRKFGINSSIYRVGNLSIDSKGHYSQETINDNAFFIKLKTFLHLGYIPREFLEVEISPVDYTASAIIKLFNQDGLQNQTFHVFNPYKCNIVKLLDSVNGISVKSKSLSKFIDILLNNIKENGTNEGLELFMLHYAWLQDIKLDEITQITILQDKTNSILQQLGFRWKSITRDMLLGLVKRFYEVGI
jgi:surfactin family lipopeptide synthetase A